MTSQLRREPASPNSEAGAPDGVSPIGWAGRDSASWPPADATWLPRDAAASPDVSMPIVDLVPEGVVPRRNGVTCTRADQCGHPTFADGRMMCIGGVCSACFALACLVAFANAERRKAWRAPFEEQRRRHVARALETIGCGAPPFIPVRTKPCAFLVRVSDRDEDDATPNLRERGIHVSNRPVSCNAGVLYIRG